MRETQAYESVCSVCQASNSAGCAGWALCALEALTRCQLVCATTKGYLTRERIITRQAAASGVHCPAIMVQLQLTSASWQILLAPTVTWQPCYHAGNAYMALNRVSVQGLRSTYTSQVDGKQRVATLKSPCLSSQFAIVH